MSQTGIDQSTGIAGIDCQIAHRRLHALTDQREIGEMKHPIETPSCEDRVQRHRIGEVAVMEVCPCVDGGAMAGLQIVEHHHLIAARDQPGNKVAADKPGTPDDQIAIGHTISPADADSRHRSPPARGAAAR